MADPRKPLLLIIDDDTLITDTLAVALAPDFDVVSAHSRAQALQVVGQMRSAPDLALVDLGLPPDTHRPDQGFALIGELLAHAPKIGIVVLSGQGHRAHGKRARALGAAEFVDKPCNPGTLRDLLLKLYRLADAPGTAPRLIGDSAAMTALREQIGQFANTPFPVLIEGESGSGKEVVVAELHARSNRADRPMLALNCAAIAPTLVEPTLFGYAKGAFTGAAAAHAGYFEDAADGVLFLDEIGELPIDLQAKLLRVLENGEYQRVGETQTRRSKARIITATNRNLQQEVAAGRFRNDLYHRLSVFTLHVPPLRQRGTDRQQLLEHFRSVYARQAGLPPFALDDAANARWLAYGFPGNVRELRNIVIRLVARHGGKTVSLAALEPELSADSTLSKTPASPPPGELPSEPAAALAIALKRLRDDRPFSLDETLHVLERGFIDAALELSDGNVSQAARRLGLSRTTLYHRMGQGSE